MNAQQTYPVLKLKVWSEHKVVVSEEEYRKAVESLGGWKEINRLEFPEMETSVRVSHRETGKMVAGWDKKDGAYTHWVVR